MPRVLIFRCPKCGEAQQALDPRRMASGQLGQAIQQAANQDLSIEFTSGPVELGCECSSRPTPGRSLRLNIRQLMVITTAACVIVAILRHPISMVLGSNAWKAAAIPWQFYGWLFLGGELPSADAIGGGPVHILLFCVNAVLAALAGYAVVHALTLAFIAAWRWTTKPVDDS